MLNRNSIKNGVIYNLLKKNQHITNMAPKTLEERSASLELTLSKAPNGAVKNGIWIFGYGSLILFTNSPEKRTSTKARKFSSQSPSLHRIRSPSRRVHLFQYLSLIHI